MISAGEGFRNVGACDTATCRNIQTKLDDGCIIAAGKIRENPELASSIYREFLDTIKPIRLEDGTEVEPEKGLNWPTMNAVSNACYKAFMTRKKLPSRTHSAFAPIYEEGEVTITEIMNVNNDLMPPFHIQPNTSYPVSPTEFCRDVAGVSQYICDLETRFDNFILSQGNGKKGNETPPMGGYCGIAKGATQFLCNLGWHLRIKSTDDFCENATGASRFLCDLERRGGENDATDKVWKCVTDRFTEAGGSIEELEGLTNVGFIKDPTQNPVPHNEPRLEPQEKLSFAYANPELYGCIAAAGLPMPFAMNDFSHTTTFDDKKREEVDDEISKLMKKMGTSASNFDIAKKIFDMDAEKHHFYSDCPIECTDYEALKYDQGRCSETSAFFFHQAQEADIGPQFFHMRDFEPSLDWISYLEYVGNAAEHVFVGIPPEIAERPLEPSDYIHIDLTNRRSDAKYAFAKPISERDFAALWQFNKAIDLVSFGRLAEAEEAIARSLAASPDNITPYLFLINYYEKLGRNDDLKFLSSYIDRHFSGHPWAEFFKLQRDVATYIAGNFDKDKLQSKIEETSARMQAIAKKNPKATAQIFYFIAQSALGDFIQKYKIVVQGKSVSGKLQQELYEGMRGIVLLLANSLFADPNYFFAYRDLEALLDESDNDEIGIEIYSKLLNKYPEHTPFLYALGKHYLNGALAKGANKKDFLTKAEETAEKLLSLDPESPHPYNLLASSHANAGDFNTAHDELLKSMELCKKRGETVPLDVYSPLVDSCIFLGKKDEALNFIRGAIETHGDAAAEVIASNFSQRSSWYYTVNQPKYITDEIISFSIDDSLKNIATSIVDICKFLDDYKKAKPYVQLIRTYFLPFVTIFADKETGRRWLRSMPQKPSEKTLKALAATTQRLAEILLGFNAPVEEGLSDATETYLGWVKKWMLDSNPTIYFTAKLGVAWGYILKGNERAVQRVLSGIPAKERIPRLEFCIGRLLTSGRESPFAARCMNMVLGFSWQIKDSMTPSQKAKFSWYYDELARICAKNQMPVEAGQAEKRAEHLRK